MPDPVEKTPASEPLTTAQQADALADRLLAMPRYLGEGGKKIAINDAYHLLAVMRALSLREQPSKDERRAITHRCSCDDGHGNPKPSCGGCHGTGTVRLPVRQHSETPEGDLTACRCGDKRSHLNEPCPERPAAKTPLAAALRAAPRGLFTSASDLGRRGEQERAAGNIIERLIDYLAAAGLPSQQETERGGWVNGEWLPEVALVALYRYLDAGPRLAEVTRARALAESPVRSGEEET